MLTEVVLVRYQLQCSGLTVTAPQPPGQQPTAQLRLNSLTQSGLKYFLISNCFHSHRGPRLTSQ